MKRKLFYRLLLTVVILLQGCAADRNAQGLARETLAQTVEYEDSVRSLSRTLAAADEADLAILTASATAIGQIAEDSTALQLAEDLTDKLVDRPFQAADFRGFVLETTAQQARARLTSLQALESLAKERDVRQAQVAAQEKELKSLRAKLEKLQLPWTMEEEVTRLKPLLDEARKAYDETKAKDKPVPATQP